MSLPSRSEDSLLAVDIGNSFAKLGLFPSANVAAANLPSPTVVFDFATAEGPAVSLLENLPIETLRWRVSSVNRAGFQKLAQFVRQHRPADDFQQLSYRDLPIEVLVDEPDKVGLDRLAAAVAANVLRPSNTPAIVVGAGTAVTVNLISETGAFLGGTILPGFRLSAEALFGGADFLPLARIQPNDEPPPVVGKNTNDAIRSGLFWGAVGSVREIVTRMKQELAVEPALFVTGGDLRRLSPLVAEHAQYLPHLVLSGIAVASSQRT
ncbi:type III pantothenate kinase [Anatilimnocola floriformis]|uniref:type III pantothenate kinase n=1 Tax=Anatilimnocola floriformis TaxID=2948575 RepID=UPI0020C51A14|nr:type III pantothenate kinase [Anatilimnocola floriformis]